MNQISISWNVIFGFWNVFGCCIMWIHRLESLLGASAAPASPPGKAGCRCVSLAGGGGQGDDLQQRHGTAACGAGGLLGG